MAVFAAVRTPNSAGAPDSTPRRIVAALPAVEIEVVQFDQREGRAIPYFWVHDVAPDRFAPALSEDPQVEGVERLEDAADGALFRAEWDVDSPLIHCVAAADGKVRRAVGTEREWQLDVWFERQADASAFHDHCASRTVPVEFDRVTPLSDVVDGDDGGLTDRQRDALALARETGYFAEPREVTQAELAERLGISATAVGRRLRRGTAALVETHLRD